MWCDTHYMMDSRMDNQVMEYYGFRSARTIDNAYMRGSMPSLWTNPLTAQASQDALDHPQQPDAKSVSFASAAPKAGTAVAVQSKQQAALSPTPSGWWAQAMTPPAQLAPAKPLTPMKEALKSSGMLFTFMRDHYNTDDWVSAVLARPANPSYAAQKTLAKFIDSQSGVDVSHLFDEDPTDPKEIVLTTNAGVKYFEVFAEVAARENIVRWHPYIFQELLNRTKFADQAKKDATKLDLIDALVSKTKTNVGTSFTSFKTAVLLWVDSQKVTVTYVKDKGFTHILPAPLPGPDTEQYNTDVLMGYASEVAVKEGKIATTKDLDMNQPAMLVMYLFDRLAAMDSVLCDNASTGQKEPCSAWVIGQAKLMQGTARNMSDYIAQNKPPFVQTQP